MKPRPHIIFMVERYASLYDVQHHVVTECCHYGVRKYSLLFPFKG